MSAVIPRPPKARGGAVKAVFAAPKRTVGAFRPEPSSDRNKPPTKKSKRMFSVVFAALLSLIFFTVMPKCPYLTLKIKL